MLLRINHHNIIRTGLVRVLGMEGRHRFSTTGDMIERLPIRFRASFSHDTVLETVTKDSRVNNVIDLVLKFSFGFNW
jgi:hypothetical protein